MRRTCCSRPGSRSAQLQRARRQLVLGRARGGPRWPGPQYLETTNDTTFVSQYFHDDASGPEPVGAEPVHDDAHRLPVSAQRRRTGYLKRPTTTTPRGPGCSTTRRRWPALAAYKYIATRIGNTAEAQWADGAYTSLLNATNAGLSANEQANGFSFLPCEVNVSRSPATGATRPTTPTGPARTCGARTCGTSSCRAARSTASSATPAQTDNLYQTGLRPAGRRPACRTRRSAPTPVTASRSTPATRPAALYGNQYRDLPITSYAWQIATTTGGPNAWWEANGSAPDPSNPWAGSHAAPQFGAVPYVWPMAGQTQTLLQSLVATGLISSAGADGALQLPDRPVRRPRRAGRLDHPGPDDLGRQPDLVLQRGQRQTVDLWRADQHQPGAGPEGGHGRAQRSAARDRHPGPAACVGGRGRGRGRSAASTTPAPTPSP